MRFRLQAAQALLCEDGERPSQFSGLKLFMSSLKPASAAAAAEKPIGSRQRGEPILKTAIFRRSLLNSITCRLSCKCQHVKWLAVFCGEHAGLPNAVRE
jgi:hypothetical protein